MAKIKKAMKGGSKVADNKKKGPETEQEKQLRFDVLFGEEMWEGTAQFSAEMRAAANSSRNTSDDLA